MIRVRKGVVYLFSLLLLIALLGTALSTSVKHTLGHPAKVETMLAQSKLYDHFVDYTADQAKQSEGDTDKSGSVSLGDAAVQSAARSAFPPKLIQQSVNTFIESNYAWLEGKTATPEFKIDLTSQKETFAQKVGRYVRNYTASLPVCTPAQAVTQTGIDPLAADCRPDKLSPDEAGSNATERLRNTGDFLSNPVITADSVNPKGNQTGEPYYKKLSRLPHIYRVGNKLPYIFGALSVLLAIGVLFVALTRRSGLRRLGAISLVAGIVLVISKFVADSSLNGIEKHVFNDSDAGPLQKSLTDFVHRVASSVGQVNMWFGIAFIILALAIFIGLLKTRTARTKGSASRDIAGSDKLKGEGQASTDSPESPDNNRRLPRIMPRRRTGRMASDGIMPRGNTRPQPDKPSEVETVDQPESESESAAQPKRRKPPRLIQ